MKVNQIYEIVNQITKEQLGENPVLNEDLSNIVDIGEAFENAHGLDNFVRSLVDKVGRVVFVDRVLTSRVPSVIRDGWEFGSILQKIRMELPEASENEAWALTDGTVYEQDLFTAPKVHAKFFNDRVTFEVAMSFTDEQVKSAFNNAMQLNAFMSMIYTSIENSLTIKNDALIMRTINALIGETLHSEFSAGAYNSGSGVRAVNLMYLYNQTVPTAEQVTATNAIYNPGFIRFASYTIKNYIRRMQDMSRLFNIGQTEKFTPADRMHFVMLDEFKNAAEVYLYDGLNQFNTEGIRLPASIETVSYWQGSGIDYGFDSTSAINIKTPSGDNVVASGIIGVIFDRDTLGVANTERRVASHRNEKARFWNEWYQSTAQYFLDLDENGVVFFIA